MRSGRHSKLALAAFLIASGSVFWCPAAAAQFGSFTSDGVGIHGVPPSVTSFGFGGTPGFHGIPPSVTSLNFGRPHFGFDQRPFGFHHRHRGFVVPLYGGTYPYYAPAYPFPYDYPLDVMEPGVDDSMEEEYRGGPTIFDRRGYGMPDYSKPAARERERDEDHRADIPKEIPSSVPGPAQVALPADQPSTVLIFKDGHQLEISNYAIVGTALYDLGGGRTHKVALAELDLAATVKRNNDRGVDFRLPDGVKSN